MSLKGMGSQYSPSIAVTIVIVVAIVDIIASRYCRAASGGRCAASGARCAARIGARSGGRLPGAARSVIPHSSIVAHSVQGMQHSLVSELHSSPVEKSPLVGTAPAVALSRGILPR